MMIRRVWVLVLGLAMSASVQAEQQGAGRRASPTGTPVVVEVRSEVGSELRFAEAILMLEGEKVAHRKAPEDGDLERGFRLWSAGNRAGPGGRADDTGLPTGEHAMTVELAFEGRPVGFITYTAAYKHRVNASFVFTIDAGSRPVSIRVLATQRANADMADKNKIVVTVQPGPGSGAVPALDPRGPAGRSRR
jgi:hypothetical protein